jgi:hypothetical protein
MRNASTKTIESNNQMKSIRTVRYTVAIVALALLSTFNAQLSTAHAQGSLTPPPGPVAPVMKSLDQIEARTPLVAGQPGVTLTNGLYTITKPGSYFLTGNLNRTNVSGATFITITVSNVTLDLNGFTLFGTTGSMGVAIQATGYGYRIFNGHILGGTTQVNGVFTLAGFTGGIETFVGNSSRGSDSIISDITVRGVQDRAIWASINSVVERCLVDTAGSEGIIAGNVRDCRAINTYEDAISAGTVMNSVGKCVGTANGISGSSVEGPAVIENSYGSAVGGHGIMASSGAAINSRGVSVSGHGLFAGAAANCRGESGSGIALNVTVANNCTAYRPGGTAIQATIANGCYASAGTNIIVNKYNMP